MGQPSTFEFVIDGMSCASCVGRVERALANVPGVRTAHVNLANERATVSAQPTLAAATLVGAVQRAGYQARLARDSATDERIRQNERRRQKAWLAFAFVLSMPLLLPMALMPLGIHMVLPAWAQWALATPVQVLAGARFYRAAWGAVRAHSANMDLLVALGTTAAYGLSLFLWVRSAPGELPHLYFETSAMVITLVLLGKSLEARAKHTAAGAIRALEALRPSTVMRLEHGVPVEVPLASVRLGDRVQVLPGARIATDGRVVEGASHVDESLLTGEAFPVDKSVGDSINGGALNGEGLLVVEVTALGAETLLEGIIRLVETAQGAKAPVQRVVDRVSQVFVPVILLLALITGLGWYLAGSSLEHALVTAVSVLVIACPCALGLATPAAILAGTGAAARQGVLIKDIGIIEAASKVRHVVFDKTGTLTQGRVELATTHAVAPTVQPLLALAGALAQGSSHPLSQALQRACAEQCVERLQAASITVLPGRGIAGVVDNCRYVLGSQRVIEDAGLSAPDLQHMAAQWKTSGMSVSWLLEQAPHLRVLGVLGFVDKPRANASGVVRTLSAQGINCHMLTGDNAGSAAHIAQAVGISQVQAELLPADKAQHVAKLSAEGPVVMVGDGINDAPALAAAAIGIAMGGETDVAAQAGAVVLVRPDLSLVPATLDIAARIQRKIHQNLFWAFAYNLVGIPLAAFGLLNPMFAGAAMALSSVSVMANALLLTTWSPSTCKEA